MEYKVSELKNNLNKKEELSSTINFKNKIKDDIIDVSDISVCGTYNYIKSTDTFVFHLTITGELTALSAVSLKEVKVFIDFDTDLFYTFKVTDDDSFPIYGDTINLDEEIWGEIVLHLPLRFLLDGEEYDDSDNVELEKENPFSKLLEEE